MPTLEEELSADATRRVGCATCLFIAALPTAEQHEWHEVFQAIDHLTGKYRYATPVIARAMARRGVKLSGDAIQNHRKNHESN